MSAAPLVAVVAVTGLTAEASIARGPGIAALSGGGDIVRLARALEDYLSSGAQAVISFGIAGGLAPGLSAGTVVVGTSVEDGETLWPTDSAWLSSLVNSLPKAIRAPLFSVDQAVAGAEAKADLHRRSGAVAVDMESHVAARLAACHEVPFAALRVVADPAERSLPQAALVGMRTDGTMDVFAVLRALARRPRDLLPLIHTGFEAQAAFRALRRARLLLPERLGFEPRASKP